MTGAIVIVGAGRVGFRTAEMFAQRGTEVRVVERDHDRCEQLRRRPGIEVFEGDATVPSTLERALEGDVEAFGALTADGETNLEACLLSRELVPDARFVARVRSNPGPAYASAVGNLTLVTASSVAAAANALGADATSAVREHVGGLDVFELEMAPDAPVAGQSLEAADLPAGCLVVCAVGADRRAGADTVLDPGRSFVLAVEPDDVPATREAFGQA